ncbi:MAG: 4a-hydroxytetrahydrobiopterin dehydratase [Gammaproteobacteria bacterium]
MNPLADRKLETIPRQGYRLEQQELAQLLRQLDSWQIDRSTPEPQLVRSFKFKNFTEALGFCNRIGELAEQVDHHPSLLLEWGKVSVRWWTHTIGGLHINDFILAARTDRMFKEI